MAALTERKQVEEKDGVKISMPMVAADIIYAGAIVKVNAAGFIAPASAEAGAVSAGIAYETVDNSAGASGDKSCKIIRKGTFLLSGAGFSQTDVGQSVYASDDQTISNAQGANEQEIGKVVVFVSATQVWVDLL